MYLPQSDLNVVGVFVVVEWVGLAEHIASFVVRLKPERLSKGQALLLLTLTGQVHNMDCSDY